jgi:chromosome segregation ATPase
VILLLRTELGKAHEEVQRLRADQQEVQGSENASANKIFLHQEQELFKAREALARAQADVHADKECNNADKGRNSAKVLALDAANIMLRAEKDELKEQVRSLQEKADRANQELAKEKSAHAHAQQSYKSLETQLNNLEHQVQEQVQQQAKAHVVQLEHVRREWETKLTNAQDKYTAKMTEHDAGILELARVRSQYENKLAEKEKASACLRL